MRGVRVLVSLVLLAGLSWPATARDGQIAESGRGLRAGDQAGVQRVAAKVDWREGRMSLGHRPARRPVADLELAPERTTIHRQCQRWKALSSQLGETYAGHRLRQTVLQRMCGVSADELAEETWAWPWASLERGDVLPPKLHRVIGAWEIRCDTAGERRRCALIHRSLLPPEQQRDGSESELVVHFVIDMVAGRESVLWRIFVPGMASAPVRSELASFGLTAAQVREARGQVRYRLGTKDYAESFPACGTAGCLMEAHIQRTGAIVSRLWDGKAVDLELQIATGNAHAVALPARGFRAAFGELTRLRREELRGQARR
ncbi:MAG: hypothetical protein ACKVP7_22285 [Hyphomicrobiaceae bacterium]